MKLIKYKSIVAIGILSLFVFQGCEDILEEENQSQLAADNLLTSKLGIETVIADAYSQMNSTNRSRFLIKREEMTSDILWQTGGGENGGAVSLINFFWDSNNTLAAFDWNILWNVIRDANTVLDNIDRSTDITDKEREFFVAEARFLRIWAYYSLWNQFGSLPIRKSFTDSGQMARASEEEFSTFMESELISVIPNLPEPGKEPNYGRVTNGAARALLCKWYLNNKEWQKCANVAKEIMNSGNFQLYPSYFDLFALENERNNEFILVSTHLANQNNSSAFQATALPPGYVMGLDGGLAGVVNNTWSNFASQYRFYDEFYNSFEPGDTRRDRILTKYINIQGKEINLLDSKDNTRGMKFPPDPAAQGNEHGNDFPYIRYADILLSRAEALNELNGPNQESIDLVNMIRNRAELGNIFLANFGDKETLRDHILDERRWEFWYEGKRRRDLIRAGKYIQGAIDRGIDAQDYNIWAPIPQAEIDANKLMEQNPGY